MQLVPLALPLAQEAAGEPAPQAPPADFFPKQDPAMVLEMVGVAHGNWKRVEELLQAHPALAEAAVDWGFGDWENALGAASHMGRRDIATLLLANGARPTLFSAAMLGQIAVIRAFIEAQPGVQRIPGPHSISLLDHAKAGGKDAAEVVRYLESLGDAGAPARPAVPEDRLKELTGTYRYGPGTTEQLEVTYARGSLSIARTGGMGRGLLPLGNDEFQPVGARGLRIRFGKDDSGSNITVMSPLPALIARRL